MDVYSVFLSEWVWIALNPSIDTEIVMDGELFNKQHGVSAFTPSSIHCSPLCSGNWEDGTSLTVDQQAAHGASQCHDES